MKGRQRNPAIAAAQNMELAQSGGSSPKVQAAVDEAVEMLVGQLRAAIEEQVKKGELKKLTLSDLLDRLESIIKASKRSAPLLAQMVVPSAPQPTGMPTGPHHEKIIEAQAEAGDTAALERAQDKYLDREGRGA